MNKSIFLFDDSLADVDSNKSNALEVYVYYSLGGINYFSYKTERRGFYVSVKGVRKEDNCVSFQIGGNNPADGKALVQELKRNNKKKLAELADKVFEYAETYQEDFLKAYKAGDARMMLSLIYAAAGLDKYQEAA